MASLHYLSSPETADQGKTSVFKTKQQVDKQFKIIIIGDSYTGKTALLMRLGDGA